MITKFGIEFSVEELDELFESMDADHSGSVSIGELKTYFQIESPELNTGTEGTRITRPSLNSPSYVGFEPGELVFFDTIESGPVKQQPGTNQQSEGVIEQANGDGTYNISDLSKNRSVKNVPESGIRREIDPNEGIMPSYTSTTMDEEEESDNTLFCQ
eukprot:FR738949.1.p1 GENE.FR738949.1~~FR738949.1.p1  ORF type:complete len:166 (+),score=17.34 FR738949.1:26-499(+)